MLWKVKFIVLGLSVCVCVCPSLASRSSETTGIEVISIKLGAVTVSDMEMHHLLIILPVGLHSKSHRFNHENNKRPIILETVQAITIKCVVKIVQLKVNIIFSQSDNLALYSRSQLRLRFHKMYV